MYSPYTDASLNIYIALNLHYIKQQPGGNGKTLLDIITYHCDTNAHTEDNLLLNWLKTP